MEKIQEILFEASKLELPKNKTDILRGKVDTIEWANMVSWYKKYFNIEAKTKRDYSKMWNLLDRCQRSFRMKVNLKYYFT